MISTASIELDTLTDIGHDLNRPECVLCTSDGSVFVSDWDGGICHIASDLTQTRIRNNDTSIDLRPNGFALKPDGNFLIANLGNDGGVWNLLAGGDIEPLLTEIEGVQLPPTNFVLIDNNQRTWITVSTRIEPRANAYRPDICDGFIAVLDQDGARIAIDGLGYTNEVQVHPSGQWLYVNETFARRTSRMRIFDDTTLGNPETVAEYGAGTFPDGLCFDEEGAFWIVSLVSNRVIRVTDDGKQQTIIEDADEEFLMTVESAFQSGIMSRLHLDNIRSNRLKSISSIAFGGPDRRSSYLGCLLDDRITSFRSPVAGIKPVHWNWRMK